MAPSLKVALVQQLGGQDPAPLVRTASLAQADIVVFPEMYSNGYARFEPGDPTAEAQWRAGALSPDSEFVEGFRQAARRHRVHVVATFLESGDPDPFNTALLLDPDGNTLLRHRKVYICDFDSPESACGRGTGFGVVEIEARAGPVALGLMICMDREYPDAAVSLSSQGAEIALVPNCCALAQDPTVGDVRLAQTRGRAFETVMGIAVANYPAPRCDGHSHAVDCRGEMIASAGVDPDVLLADFDLAFLRAAREEDWFRWRR